VMPRLRPRFGAFASTPANIACPRAPTAAHCRLSSALPGPPIPPCTTVTGATKPLI
jgi:hypothetical protein